MTDPKRSKRSNRTAETARPVPQPTKERRESSKRAAEAVRRRKSAAERSAVQSEKVIEERAKLNRSEPDDSEAVALEEKKAVLATAEARPQRATAANDGLAQGNTIAAGTLLSIYLNDHLAGSTIGVALARRACAKNRGTPLGDHLERLTSEIESDRETLERLVAQLGVRRNRLKAFGAWATEKLRRLKLNGQLAGYSPLSRLVELESLYLGITGKRELWRALQRTLGTDARGFDFEELDRRAERQAANLEVHRLEAARMALSLQVK
ncbi:MAG: hypothetical protein ACREMY_03920 [bacterium]